MNPWNARCNNEDTRQDVLNSTNTTEMNTNLLHWIKTINNGRRRDSHPVRATQLTANPIQNISHTVSFILFFFLFVRFYTDRTFSCACMSTCHFAGASLISTKVPPFALPQFSYLTGHIKITQILVTLSPTPNVISICHCSSV